MGNQHKRLHPISMLDDDAPLTGPPHRAAPTLSPTLLLPGHSPSHAQYPARKPHPPFQKKALLSKGNLLPRLIRVALDSSSQHENWSPRSLFHSAFCICHCHTHMCINNQHHWLLWMLQSKAAPRSHCDHILSIWIYRPDLRCLSFTVKIVYGEVNRSLVPFSVWPKMEKEPASLSSLLSRAGILFGPPTCTAQSLGL